MKVPNRPLGMVFLLLGCLPLSSPAQESDGSAAPATTSAGQIKKNIHQSKKDLAEIEKKLLEEKKRKRLDEIKEKRELNKLQSVDQTLGKLRREKEANEEDLHETHGRVSQLKSEMAQNQEQLAQNRQLLKRRLGALYRMSFRQPFWGGLLGAESFSDLARKLKFGMILAQNNEKLLAQTLQTNQTLEQEEAQWDDNAHREKRILSVLGRQETNYSRERKNRTIFLASLQRQKEEREKVIGELNQAAQDLQEKVASLLQQADEGKRQQAAWVSAGQGLTVKRGRIPWPVSGKIIQSFGRYKNPEFKEVVENNGIQIQAPEGTPFRAVASGVVRYADWFKGFGKLVILDHGGGYYSLYGQAAELKVSQDEKVEAGEALGEVGDTESFVGPSLYFEIRKNGVPQDPALWLKRHM